MPQTLMSDNNWQFIGAAYAITWIVLLTYLVRVHTALRRARAAHTTAIANSTERAS